MNAKRYAVACLAGHGIGPEVTAQATRALAAASHLHGFVVDDLHVPFGSEALVRFGHPFPLSSRRAVLEADSVLLASADPDPLDVLEAELDLRASVARVRLDASHELSILAPLRAEAWEWTLERAFALARTSTAHVTVVSPADDWSEVAARHDGIEVEQIRTPDALRALLFTPERFDVVVCGAELASTTAELAASGRRTAAWGRLAPAGPSVFGPTHGPDTEIAGQDAADPSSMLLAAALMLGEGLGERCAAATLAGAVGRAGRADGETRRHTDHVLDQLPLALANAEFYRGEAA
jgi:isocitrate/isopropylmalate dehydrogenase